MKTLGTLLLSVFGAVLVILYLLHGPRSFDEVELQGAPPRGPQRLLHYPLQEFDTEATKRTLTEAILATLPVEPPAGHHTVLRVQVTRRRGRRDWHLGLPPWKEVVEIGESAPWRIVYHPPPKEGWQARGAFGPLGPETSVRGEAATEFIQALLGEIERYRSNGGPPR